MSHEERDSREETTRVSPRIQSKLAPLAAQEIQNLKSSLQETNSDNQELKTAICKATKEHEETRRALQITRATLCRKDEETRALEERLEDVAQHLLDQHHGSKSPEFQMGRWNKGGWKNQDGWTTVLPKDAQKSAKEIMKRCKLHR